MHRQTRLAVALSGGLMSLAMSACFTASRAYGGDSFERGATSSYSASGSVSGGPKSPTSSVSTAADLDPGDTIPSGYWEDRAQGKALTSYLDKNRLPMVGAQVFTNSSGNRRVILHGFVATDSGKRNAAARARRYLGDPALPVINRILVRPESRPGNSDASSAPPPPVASSNGSSSDAQVGNAETYQSQAQQVQSQAQSQRDLDTIVLILRLMTLLF